MIGASVAGYIAGRPPDPVAGVRLAYGIDGDIYVADADGRDPVMIADGHSEAGCGPFEGNGRLVSPDGRHLAYGSSWEGACTRAYTIHRPDGHVISTIPSDGWRVSWSPDGTRFATWLAFGQTVGIYGVDGAPLAVLDGSQACCGDHDPVWSPDGAESVLLRSRYPSRIEQAVLELPVDGGTPHPVPADDPRSLTYALGWQPMVYSPDGTYAAFADSGPADAPITRSLVVVAADGDATTELAKGDVQEGPTWSPTGDRIAFVVSLPTRVELRVVDVASGAETTLAGVPRPGSMRTFGFSPDGGRVLFGQMGADASPSIDEQRRLRRPAARRGCTRCRR